MTLRIGTANIKDTLPPHTAQAALNHVAPECDILGLQEWGGANRNRILARTGSLRRGPVLKKHKPAGEWTWTRPLIGGGPVGARTATATLLACHARVLHLPGRVEGTAQAGVPRRGYLPTSWATTTRWDLHDGLPHLVVINIHLTAEVQQGKAGYRADMPLRVMRHRRERRNLQKLVNRHLAKGRRVAVVGDTNFHEMPIDNLTGWWEAPHRPTQTGTEGNRTIDVIETSFGAPYTVRIFQTRSDHRHPVATYKENQ